MAEEDLSTLSTTESQSESITTVDALPTTESITTVDDEEDLKFGFKRPEMYSDKFPKSVVQYDRHVFLSFKSSLTWPARVEDVAYDPLPSQFALALKNRKNDIHRKTRFTVIEGGVEAGFCDGDVLIFPDMIKYKNLSHEGVDDFVEDVLVKETSSQTLGSPEKLTGFHLFVCSHASRDKRCGVCGPVLIEKLKEEIKLRGLEDQVFVSPCSHVGGHKYAGNVIVFGPNSDEKVMGHWYGYVTPEDVPLLLDQHIGKGEVIEHLWRGEVCHTLEEKTQESDLKPQESDDVPHQNGISSETYQTTKSSMQNGGGCCQGANGVTTCCRDEKVELLNTAETKPRKGGNTFAKRVGKMSAWMDKIDQSDVLVGAAVIGAIGTVAVAYSIYRRSS